MNEADIEEVLERLASRLELRREHRWEEVQPAGESPGLKDVLYISLWLNGRKVDEVSINDD